MLPIMGKLGGYFKHQQEHEEDASSSDPTLTVFAPHSGAKVAPKRVGNGGDLHLEFPLFSPYGFFFAG